MQILAIANVCAPVFFPVHNIANTHRYTNNGFPASKNTRFHSTDLVYKSTWKKMLRISVLNESSLSMFRYCAGEKYRRNGGW